MPDYYVPPKSYSQREAFVLASARLPLGTSPEPRAPTWDVEHVRQELVLRPLERPRALVEEVFHLVAELPDLCHPQRSAQPVVEVTDLLGTVRQGRSLIRPAAMQRLAAKAAARAAEIRVNPPSEAEIEEWARRLGEEAADLTD